MIFLDVVSHVMHPHARSFSARSAKMTTEAKAESWKELSMYKYHMVALMQLSKQPTKATLGSFFPVMNKNKSRFLLGVPKYVNT